MDNEVQWRVPLLHAENTLPKFDGTLEVDPILTIQFDAALEAIMQRRKKKWSSKQWGVEALITSEIAEHEVC